MIKLPRNEYNIFQLIDRAIAQHELSLNNVEEIMNYMWIKVSKSAKQPKKKKA